MEKVRLNTFDNLKGIAILMIVFWHLHVDGFPLILQRVVIITSLPLFFFVAGYFSKTTPDQPVKIFKRLMVPYIIFSILIRIFFCILSGKIVYDFLFVQSEIALWFLMALFIMKITLPIIDKMRYPLLTSFVFAIFFGFIDIHPNILGLTRCFAYFPLFILGFRYNQYKEKISSFYPKLDYFYKKHFKLLFVLFVAVLIVVISTISAKHMVFKAPYQGNILYEMIKRCIVLITAMMWVSFLNEAITNRNYFITKFGRNSMAVYLLHIFIVILWMRMPDFFMINKPITLACNLLFIFAVTFVLSRDIINRYLNRFTDSIADLILKPDS